MRRVEQNIDVGDFLPWAFAHYTSSENQCWEINPLHTKYNKIIMTDISVQVFVRYACTSAVHTFCISLSLKLCVYIETPTPSFLKAFVHKAVVICLIIIKLIIIQLMLRKLTAWIFKSWCAQLSKTLADKKFPARSYLFVFCGGGMTLWCHSCLWYLTRMLYSYL